MLGTCMGSNVLGRCPNIMVSHRFSNVALSSDDAYPYLYTDMNTTASQA